jgi:hypothetical protein
MALLFTSGSNDRVNFGSGATLDNVTTGTTVAWVYPTSLAADQRFWQKGLAGTGNYWGFAPDFSVGSGTLGIEIQRATSNCEAISVTGTLTANVWNFVCATWNTGGAAGDQRLYVGTLTANAAEASYSSQTAGSGSVGDNSGADLIGCNRSTGGIALVGRMAVVALWNRQLTLGEIIEQQWRPRPTSGCVLMAHLGYNGTGSQPDWSGNGNAGTVTGATVIDHVPVASPFAWVPDYSSYVVAGDPPLAGKLLTHLQSEGLFVGGVF